LRWSAVSTVEAAAADGVTVPGELRRAAERRHAEPSFVPAVRDEVEHDLALASAAVGIAVRRHAGRQRVAFSPEGRLVERTGKDLREVDLLVGSGGVLRHNAPADAIRVLSAAVGDHVDGGWLVPRAPAIMVDRDYVLAAAGLLAPEHPDAAYALLGPLRHAAR
jgi:uncharacterized protein (TIGR01319 family)